MKNVSKILGMISLLLFSACGKDSGKTSSFEIQLPGEANSVSQKVGKQSVTCYAISLSGQGIDRFKPGSCDPEYGQFVGLVSPGQSIKMSVEYGRDRTLDIYQVTDVPGCGDLRKQGLGSLGSEKVHRIVHQTGLVFDQPNVEINVTAEAPSVANSFEALYGLANSCRSVPSSFKPNPNLRIVMGYKRGQATNGDKYSVRVLDQSIKVPPTTSDKLIPHRLGDGL